uniref:Spectrin beta, non-erythrocytic 5 n=1 Tax=Rousettus aegyptiacus TaxID=9407 RepID=A0A7J8ISU8_ROUAE|nr:spectrin beta, non-erythrocytic 5 [Rousettus aegyptiacus]
MERKLPQQAKGLKPGRVGSGLTSLQHRPLGSWWPRAWLAETRDLQPGVPVGQHIPLATIVSLEQAARPQQPSGALGVRATTWSQCRGPGTWGDWARERSIADHEEVGKEWVPSHPYTGGPVLCAGPHVSWAPSCTFRMLRVPPP